MEVLVLPFVLKRLAGSWGRGSAHRQGRKNPIPHRDKLPSPLVCSLSSFLSPNILFFNPLCSLLFVSTFNLFFLLTLVTRFLASCRSFNSIDHSSVPPIISSTSSFSRNPSSSQQKTSHHALQINPPHPSLRGHSGNYPDG